jgi:hypothetical protein
LLVFPLCILSEFIDTPGTQNRDTDVGIVKPGRITYRYQYVSRHTYLSYSRAFTKKRKISKPYLNFVSYTLLGAVGLFVPLLVEVSAHDIR